MNISWLFCILLLAQQADRTDQILIQNKEKNLSIVNRSDFTMPLLGEPFIDTKKYDHFLWKLDKLVSKKAQNASLDKFGNIVPEKIGYRLNRPVFNEKFYSQYFNRGPGKIVVPLVAEYPEIDSELLANISSKRIGKYVTSFNLGNKKRTKNIYLAANAINNTVIFPGDTFSFNKVVGKRTAEKGYLPAPVIVRGEVAEDIGGGICQVSSTLFNAVDNAGLQILQRFSHSRKVPYIPPGRDATVSWYGPDFVFKNKYHQPVLIQAKTIGNKLVVKIYSSDVIEHTPRAVPSPPY